MKLTLTQLTSHLERVCDWRDDWEQRCDDAVAQRWLADDALAALEAEGELIRRRMISMAHRIPGCLRRPADGDHAWPSGRTGRK